MNPTLVIVPGLRAHVDEHWQSRLAAVTPGAVIVDSTGREKRDLDGRVHDLQHTIETVNGPVLLIAHSAGVLTTLHWASRRAADTSVAGALLATPPDLAKPLPAEYPSLAELTEAGWLPIPRARLPFPSIVAMSTNDPLSEPANIREFAAAWGSEIVEVGAVGHLNPAAGFGPWPQAEELICSLAELASPSVVR